MTKGSWKTCSKYVWTQVPLYVCPSWCLWLFQHFFPTVAGWSLFQFIITDEYLIWQKASELSKESRITFSDLWLGASRLYLSLGRGSLGRDVTAACLGRSVHCCRWWGVSAGGRGGRAAPLGLYWTVREKRKQERNKPSLWAGDDQCATNVWHFEAKSVKRDSACSWNKHAGLLHHMISGGRCSEQMHGVNRPSCVNVLHGKHHSLCVWLALWCNLDQHQEALKKARSNKPRPLRLLSWAQNCLFSPTGKNNGATVPRSHTSKPQTNTSRLR